MVEKKGGDATIGPEDQCVIDMLTLMFGAENTESIIGLLRDFEKEQTTQSTEDLT